VQLRSCLLVLAAGALAVPLSAVAGGSPGSVIAWGCGGGLDSGQCSVPAAATTGVVAIAAGESHSLALKRDGSVVAWGCGGDENRGQCSVPEAATSGVTAIAAGIWQSLALKNGGVIAWGCGINFGQCNVPSEA